ncbi:MAG TPA: DUF309 domain-containing protein [Desulfurivibrionaceae bacterium]|nr:DUF309 domain-containing protein [Desulfurivibrionaceae bacterium]
MTDRLFDPLNDRQSRDIRNALSEAFAEALTKTCLAPVDAVAAQYQASGLAPVYEAYIADRLMRYQEALRIIGADTVNDVFTRALVLWDLGLFFEVHEILEHAWLAAHGAEKEILQAMIRAAGMYIKLAMGQPEAAHKMAAKAVKALVEHRTLVPALLPLDRLLAALKACDPQPPRLYEPQRST